MSFIPEIPVILSFAIASLILAATPGPDMTLFVARTLSDGRAAGFACVAGAMTGILIHTLMVALGLSALVVASPAAFTALKWIGAAYLLFLAIQAIRHGSVLSVSRAQTSRKPLSRHWAQGLGVNLLNPKIILFFMTFLPQFVNARDPHITGKLIFLGFSFVIISLPVVIAIVLGAQQIASWLKENPRAMRIIDWLFAGIFSLFAVRILLTQAR